MRSRQIVSTDSAESLDGPVHIKMYVCYRCLKLIVKSNSRRDLHGKIFVCVEDQVINAVANLDSRTKSHFIHLDILPLIIMLCFTEKPNSSLRPAVTQSSIALKVNILCTCELWAYNFIERILLLILLQRLHTETLLKQCLTLGCSSMICYVRMLASDESRSHIHKDQ